MENIGQDFKVFIKWLEKRAAVKHAATLLEINTIFNYAYRKKIGYIYEPRGAEDVFDFPRYALPYIGVANKPYTRTLRLRIPAEQQAAAQAIAPYASFGKPFTNTSLWTRNGTFVYIYIDCHWAVLEAFKRKFKVRTWDSANNCPAKYVFDVYMAEVA